MPWIQEAYRDNNSQRKNRLQVIWGSFGTSILIYIMFPLCLSCVVSCTFPSTMHCFIYQTCITPFSTFFFVFSYSLEICDLFTHTYHTGFPFLLLLLLFPLLSIIIVLFSSYFYFSSFLCSFFIQK